MSQSAYPTAGSGLRFPLHLPGGGGGGGGGRYSSGLSTGGGGGVPGAAFPGAPSLYRPGTGSQIPGAARPGAPMPGSNNISPINRLPPGSLPGGKSPKMPFVEPGPPVPRTIPHPGQSFPPYRIPIQGPVLPGSAIPEQYRDTTGRDVPSGWKPSMAQWPVQDARVGFASYRWETLWRHSPSGYQFTAQTFADSGPVLAIRQPNFIGTNKLEYHDGIIWKECGTNTLFKVNGYRAVSHSNFVCTARCEGFMAPTGTPSNDRPYQTAAPTAPPPPITEPETVPNPVIPSPFLPPGFLPYQPFPIPARPPDEPLDPDEPDEEEEEPKPYNPPSPHEPIPDQPNPEDPKQKPFAPSPVPGSTPGSIPAVPQKFPPPAEPSGDPDIDPSKPITPEPEPPPTPPEPEVDPKPKPFPDPLPDIPPLPDTKPDPEIAPNPQKPIPYPQPHPDTNPETDDPPPQRYPIPTPIPTDNPKQEPFKHPDPIPEIDPDRYRDPTQEPKFDPPYKGDPVEPAWPGRGDGTNPNTIKPPPQIWGPPPEIDFGRPPDYPSDSDKGGGGGKIPPHIIPPFPPAVPDPFQGGDPMPKDPFAPPSYLPSSSQQGSDDPCEESGDKCQQSMSQKLDKIKKKQDEQDEINWQRICELSCIQDIQDKLDELLSRKPDTAEYQTAMLPVVKKLTDGGEQALIRLQIKPGSLNGEDEKRFADTAQYAIEGLYEPPYQIVIPESQEVKLSGNTPHLVLFYREKTSQDKWSQNGVMARFSIPHYTGPRAKPSLLGFNRGSFQGCLVLNDNSKVIVYASSRAEAQKVLDFAKTFVPGDKLTNSITKFSEISKNFRNGNVVFFKAFYYLGLGEKPVWSIRHDGKISEGK